MDTVFQRIQPNEYYKRFLDFQIRPDGRDATAVRDVRVMKGVLRNNPTVIGSAIVAAGHSRFLAAVTAEIAAPNPTAPKSGKVFVNVEFPKSCGAGDDSGALAATVTLRAIFSNPEIINLTQFCIKDRVAVWILNVNVVCLEYDGNVLDWSMCSVCAALEDSVLPSVEWDAKEQWWRCCSSNDGEDGWDSKDGEDEDMEGQNEGEILRWDSRAVELVGRPFSITLAKVLENYWLVDPTLDESQLGDLVTIWRASPTAAITANSSTKRRDRGKNGMTHEQPSDQALGHPSDQALGHPSEQALGQLHLLRCSAGAPLDVHGLLCSLFEISRNGLQAMENAVNAAVQSDDSEENMWEIYSSGGDDSNSERHASM